MNRVFQSGRVMREQFLSGTGSWGMARLGILLIVMSIFMLALLFLYPQSGMPDRGLRYFFIPPLIALGVLFASARFIQHAYGLKSYRTATRYLLAALFAFDYPVLVARESDQLQEQETVQEQENPMEIIGGPGQVLILPGSVALIESLQGSARVVGSGRFIISRYEKVKDVVGLEEREDQPRKEISATTKDGIEILVKDVRYRYRLLRDTELESKPGQYLQESLTYSKQAVLSMVYNRSVNDNGVPYWKNGVRMIVESVITGYIQEHLVDQLTAPSLYGADPRREIKERFESESTRKRLADIGAELLWVGIGHFEIPDKKMKGERTSTRREKWIGDSKVMDAYGNSKNFVYQELGRAEAQAEMLMSIVHVWDDITKEAASPEQKRSLYLARVTQLLDAMQAQGQVLDQNQTRKKT